MEIKLFRFIVDRIKTIDASLVEIGEKIGESKTVTETINLRTKSLELLAARDELGGILKQMNRPVIELETIKYINNEERR